MRLKADECVANRMVTGFAMICEGRVRVLVSGLVGAAGIIYCCYVTGAAGWQCASTGGGLLWTTECVGVYIASLRGEATPRGVRYIQYVVPTSRAGRFAWANGGGWLADG